MKSKETKSNKALGLFGCLHVNTYILLSVGTLFYHTVGQLVLVNSFCFLQ